MSIEILSVSNRSHTGSRKIRNSYGPTLLTAETVENSLRRTRLTPAIVFGVSTAQLIGDVMWKQLIIDANGTEIFNSGPTHSYRAFIVTELAMSQEYKNTYLSVAGYKGDSGDPDSPNSEGHLARKKLIAGSKALYLDGQLHFDLGQQSKILLSMLDLTFRLFRHEDSFLLNSFDAGINYKIKVRNLKMNIDTWELTPSLNLELEKKLQNNLAVYEQVKTEIKTFTIPAGQRHAPANALFTGPIPTRIIIGEQYCYG
jgi:hypothetical protein